MLGTGDGRAQCRLLMDHRVTPSDRDACGDWSPQFGDSHLPGGHRDQLRGPRHPKDLPALPRSPVVHRMSTSVSLGLSPSPIPRPIHGP